MAATGTWVMLGYRMPREPSTPRIVVWRRLRRLGAAQPLDGLVLLPESPRTREALEWVAERVQDAAGTATLWTATHSSAADERALIEMMNAAITGEYAGLADVAAAARAQPDEEPAALRRTAARLARVLAEIQARDYFGASGRPQAEKAVTALLAVAKRPDKEAVR